MITKKKNKTNNYQNGFFNIQNFNNQERVNIYDCFEYDNRQQFFPQYCNVCKESHATYYSDRIFFLPEVCICIINRGKGIEYNIGIDFQEYINLSKYCRIQAGGVEYKLIGVITHIGESSMSGHFIAFCRDPITGEFYKYNDAFVTKVEDYYKEIVNFAMPYILFYQKVDGYLGTEKKKAGYNADNNWFFQGTNFGKQQNIQFVQQQNIPFIQQQNIPFVQQQNISFVQQQNIPFVQQQNIPFVQ